MAPGSGNKRTAKLFESFGAQKDVSCPEGDVRPDSGVEATTFRRESFVASSVIGGEGSSKFPNVPKVADRGRRAPVGRRGLEAQAIDLFLEIARSQVAADLGRDPRVLVAHDPRRDFAHRPRKNAASPRSYGGA